MRTLILDNGSFTIKAGYSDIQQPLEIPNTIARTKRTKRVYVGDLIDKSNDLSGLYYRSPFERGYLVHWDAELAVWDRALSDDVLGCQPEETNLLLTEPVFNFRRIQRSMDEMVFEEYGFSSLLRASSTKFAALGSGHTLYGNGKEEEAPECLVVVDVGHSGTYVAPYHRGRMVASAVRRMDVGGRLLTNYLKETVSFRYWDMMDETFIMNAVKERCCFVTQDFYRDLETAHGKGRGRLAVDYVLPDFAHSKTGFVRGQEPRTEELMRDSVQILPLCNERFAVPEALFHPSDVGMDQSGIHQAVFQAVMACDQRLQPAMLANILVVGGSANLPGLRDRLAAEVQALAPAGTVRVAVPEEHKPELSAWMGAQQQLHSDSPACTALDQWRVTREKYHELGPDRIIAHFDRFK
ncbi:Actin- protein 6 [Coemansia asiatica]|nr:Actin- protein 6 [Coemansia asiatica]